MNTPTNTPPWARKKIDGPLATPDLHKRIDRNFATRFLAERLELKYGTMRAQRDRIGKQIDTALNTGKLKSIDGLIRFGDLTAWARSKEKLRSAVEGLLVLGTGGAALTLPAMQGSGFSYSLPVTLDDCQDALRSAYRELNQLREEILHLRATIHELTPYKEKADAHSHIGHVNGKMGGRPKKD